MLIYCLAGHGNKLDVGMRRHGKLSEIDSELATPDLEMTQLFDGWLLRGQHQHDVFLGVLSNLHSHMRIGPEIQILNRIALIERS